MPQAYTLCAFTLAAVNVRWAYGLAAAPLCWLVAPHTLYPTYDDGQNLHLIDTFLLGDWKQLWHHGSPLFYLFWLPFRAAGVGYVGLSVLNALLGAVGIGLILDTTTPASSPLWIKPILWSVVALSPLVQVNLACFTVEAGGLLLLGMGLRCRTAFWQGLMLGCAFLWNYKLGLAGVVCGTWLISRPDTQRIQQSARFTVGFAIPLVALLFTYSILNGLHELWRPLGTYAGLLGRNANPSAPSNTGDVSFYIRYLLDWDAWHIWILGLWGMWLTYRSKTISREAWLVGAILITGLFLPKAPRWLLPAFPLIAGFVPVMTERIPWKWVLIPVWLSFIAGAVSISRQSVTHYLTDQVGNPLSAIDAINKWKLEHMDMTCLETDRSTLPYLSNLKEPVQLMPVAVPAKTSDSVCRYFLVDGYGLLTGLLPQKRQNEEAADTLLKAQTQTNAVPVLWLEHSEFTGLSYQETMERWRRYHVVSAQVVLLHRRGQAYP